jgi:hypothetical protein
MQATNYTDHVFDRENRMALPVGIVVFKPDNQKGLEGVKRAGVEDTGAGKSTGRIPDFKTHTTGYDVVIA